jgi:hypothetical protein
MFPGPEEKVENPFVALATLFGMFAAITMLVAFL